MKSLSVATRKIGLGVWLTAMIWLFGSHARSSPEPQDHKGPGKVGKLGPLIPAPVDAVHAGLSWTDESSEKICFGMRPAEYAGYHLVDPDTRELKPIFEELVYGGYGFSVGPHGLDESNENGDIRRDNFVCWELTHPDAFNDTGVYSIIGDDGSPLVSPADFELNEDSYRDAGHSTGLDYNIFCAGNAALADGRWLFVGGHDKAGNQGIRKMNIFDPVTETWEDRGMPQVKADFLADPDGTEFEHADPLDETNTDPPHPSDMRYQRWYPTAVVLPNKKVLVLSGTDQESSYGPPPDDAGPCTSYTDHAGCSKVRYATPEVYDPDTDMTIALENARKLFNMYPRSYVVQTGKGRHDWKVAVVGEVDYDYLDPTTGRPPLDILGEFFDPWTYTGKTYLFDVQAAMRDPDRDQPAHRHWEYVDEAALAHDNGAGAQLWELDRRGHAVKQRVVLFGGECGRIPEEDGEPVFDCPQDRVEMIDFQRQYPQWERQQDLIQPVTDNNAVVLPDGKVLIVGGALGGGPWVNSYHLQLFDPDDGTIEPLVKTEVARHNHSTLVLLKDGRVALMGGNATDLAGDVRYIHDTIPVTQIYSPAYLFRGERPVVEYVPPEIDYRRRFTVHLSHDSPKVGSVALIRMGPVTHNWDWGKRYVELWFKQARNGELRVQAPAVPGLAVPGYYLLFVVSKRGVPSVAELVHLDHAKSRH